MSTFTLAAWQLLRTWKLLSIVGLGILASVVFICSAPIYFDIATTTGMRTNIDTYVNGSDIVIKADASNINPKKLADANRAIDNTVNKNLQKYLDPQATQFIVEIPSSLQKNNGLFLSTVTLLGTDLSSASKHLHLLRGRIPHTSQANSQQKELEIAVSTDMATNLANMTYSKVDVGTSFMTYGPPSDSTQNLATIRLKIVGIFEPPTDQTYWNGKSFVTDTDPLVPENHKVFTALTDRSTLISLFTAKAQTPNDIFIGNHNEVTWYYTLNPQSMTIHDQAALLQAFTTLKTSLTFNSSLTVNYDVNRTQALIPIEPLQRYQGQIQLSQLPTYSMILIIFLLLLYFISVMMELLISQQTSALAVLRSRGASRKQISGALLVQGGIISLLALVASPLLAIPVARLLAMFFLPREQWSSIDAIAIPTQDTLSTGGLYALITVTVIMLTLVVSINRTTALDVLAIRRSSSRATQRSLWQRLHLDLVVVVLVIIGYVVSVYITESRVLTPQIRLLILSPLVLVRTVLTIIAVILLFVRFFPFALQLLARITTVRSRDVSSMVALAQLSRSPQQSLRLMLLLSLATAFTMFALVFSASQIQRTQDVASNIVGADLCLTMENPPNSVQIEEPLKDFGKIANVTAVSVAHKTKVRIGTTQKIANVLAVDSSTYAKVTRDATLSALLAQLDARRDKAIKEQRIPVLVEEKLWESNKLQPGTEFTVRHSHFAATPLRFVAIAKLSQVPTVTTTNGMLIDLRTYHAIYRKLLDPLTITSIDLDSIFIRTADDPKVLPQVHDDIRKARVISSLLDRNTIMRELQVNPLYLQIMGVLLLGPIISLSLILVGNLVASWLNARDRLTNFALLRALGAAPRNIASILTWEQAIVYITSIILGILFGAFLSWVAVPTLIFSSSTNSKISTEDLYVAQNIPPIQVILPALLILGIALIVLICVVALGMMVRIVSKPSMSTTLRLNAD